MCGPHIDVIPYVSLCLHFFLVFYIQCIGSSDWHGCICIIHICWMELCRYDQIFDRISPHTFTALSHIITCKLVTLLYLECNYSAYTIPKMANQSCSGLPGLLPAGSTQTTCNKIENSFVTVFIIVNLSSSGSL